MFEKGASQSVRLLSVWVSRLSHEVLGRRQLIRPIFLAHCVADGVELTQTSGAFNESANGYCLDKLDEASNLT